MDNTKRKFNAGQVVMTNSISRFIDNDIIKIIWIQRSLVRHLNGDWGDCSEDDIQMNNQALNNDSRLFSVYNKPNYLTSPIACIWIITEWDRSVTTILFPEDY